MEHIYEYKDSVCLCGCHEKPNPNDPVIFDESFAGVPSCHNGIDRVYAGDPRDRLCCNLHGVEYINTDNSIDTNIYMEAKLKIHKEYRKRHSYEFYRKGRK